MIGKDDLIIRKLENGKSRIYYIDKVKLEDRSSSHKLSISFCYFVKIKNKRNIKEKKVKQIL
jgi:hypothetical protein